MKEIKNIIAAYKDATRRGKETAIATVVHVEGSSYRRAGARMLVTDDGQLTGAISGGCLEGDALRKALLAITEGKNKLVTYDTTDEDDAKFGVQLGCNGIVHIL
ncbi:MAG TPA: XdhC family protein, partial [Chitinophagaceae bacterium]|nr:XdhC family protein [Chitinophagaceae bacterium]